MALRPFQVSGGRLWRQFQVSGGRLWRQFQGYSLHLLYFSGADSLRQL